MDKSYLSGIVKNKSVNEMNEMHFAAVTSSSFSVG